MLGYTQAVMMRLSSVVEGEVMNTRQRCILFAVAVIIAGMMLFPPFYKPPVSGYAQHIEYGFLLGSTQGRVELGLLLTQFLAAAVVGAIAFVLCADKRSN